MIFWSDSYNTSAYQTSHLNLILHFKCKLLTKLTSKINSWDFLNTKYLRCQRKVLYFQDGTILTFAMRMWWDHSKYYYLCYCQDNNPDEKILANVEKMQIMTIWQKISCRDTARQLSELCSIICSVLLS